MEELGNRTSLTTAYLLVASKKCFCTEAENNCSLCLEMKVQQSPSFQRGPKKNPSLPKQLSSRQ